MSALPTAVDTFSFTTHAENAHMPAVCLSLLSWGQAYTCASATFRASPLALLSPCLPLSLPT